MGGVIGYDGSISVSGVGFDIACGNMACKADAKLFDIQPHIKRILDDVFGQISFGVGRANNTPIDHDLFDDEAWESDVLKPMKQKGASQLGTVGSGNHYVDIFADETDTIWVGVHFDSRGIGHGTATAFLHMGGGKDWMDVPPTLVDEATEIGQSYIRATHLAGRYAYTGREYVARRIACNILGATITDEVHNHHNFA